MQYADSARTRRYTVVAHHNPVEVTLDIRRSEFIGMIRRVESEDEARAWIDDVRGVHHAATHVVPAFLLGPDRDAQRSSDDGEPSGTAGMPMLQALTNFRRSEERRVGRARRARWRPATEKRQRT